MDYVRLADPDGGFIDQETGFTLSRDDVKPLIPPIGAKTRSCLNAKGIVYCDPPKNPKQVVADQTEAAAKDLEGMKGLEDIPVVTEQGSSGSDLTLEELRALCKQHDVSFAWRDKPERLHERLAKAGVKTG